MFPSLVVIHLPGRALWYCDILSRQHDRVTVERGDTRISKEQATIIPSLKAIKPGAMLKNSELLDLFAIKFGPEIMDVSNSDFKYIQKIDWSLYTNPHQYFTSEREFLISATLVEPRAGVRIPYFARYFQNKRVGKQIKNKSSKDCIHSTIRRAITKITLQLGTTSKNKRILTTKSFTIQNSSRIH